MTQPTELVEYIDAFLPVFGRQNTLSQGNNSGPQGKGQNGGSQGSAEAGGVSSPVRGGSE